MSVSAVTASAPLASSGGSTPNISVGASTGTGNLVLASAPTISNATLTTPNIGVATGTSLVLGNSVSSLTVGNTISSGTATSILLQNATTQGLVLGIAGGPGQYSTSAILGDAVIRTTGGRLLLGVNGGAATLTILDTSSSFTSGIINVYNPNTLPRGMITAFAPNITAATSSYIFMGRDASNHNCAEISFNYQGLNSATNSAGFGLYGPSKFIITGSGNASIPGSFTNGGFDLILGNADQSSRGNSGASRALVKNSGNVLTINLGGDFTGGTTVESNLTVTGTFSSTVNWQSYRSTTSPAPNLSRVKIENWTSFGTASGQNLTIGGTNNSTFTNNLGRTVFMTITYSGRRESNGLGQTEFYIMSQDGGSAVEWAATSVNAIDYATVSAVVSINSGASIHIDGYQTSGSGNNFTENKLQIVLHH